MKVYFKIATIICVVLNIGCSNNKNKNDKKKFLALGDSYTVGEGIPDSLSWPNQLITEINKNKIHFESPKILAKTGWTSNELLFAIDSINLKETYNYVSLMIGVNDQYDGLGLQNFKIKLKKLIKKALFYSGYNSNNVFVLSIPDWGVTPFAKDRNPNEIMKEINQFNSVIMEVCENEGLKYIDITPISRQAKTNLSLVASDGLHPSEKMYSIWVKKIINQLNLD